MSRSGNPGGIGARVRRNEDPRLLTGRALSALWGAAGCVLLALLGASAGEQRDRGDDGGERVGA